MRLCGFLIDFLSGDWGKNSLNWSVFLKDFSKFVKLLEAAEPVNPYENLTAASCLLREASRGPHGEGDTGSVYPSQAKCELGISDI